MDELKNLQEKIRAAKNIVIVYPFTYLNPYYCLPPVAAEYLQSGLEHLGKSTALYDMRFEMDITEELEKADAVFLFGYFEDCTIFGKWEIHVIDQVLKAIPEAIPVLAGGTGFGDPQKAFASYPRLDVIIRGNPEAPLSDLFGSTAFANIANIVYRQNGSPVATLREVQALSNDIFPRRSLRNPKYYYHYMGMGVDLIRAGIGCNYKCKFCYQYGKDFDGKQIRWQGRTAESLYNELTQIEAPMIFWIDDDMTTDMELLDTLSDLLIANRVQKLYIATGRLDNALRGKKSTLVKLEKAGFVAIAFGIESLKTKTLKLYGKGITIAKINASMRMMQNSNILLICNFIFGSPGETEEDMLEFLWFGHQWNVDTIVTNRLRLKQDSPLYNAIYDPETKEVRPGMEIIEGEELARIKYKIKFAQRTPLRILLTFLKLYRHQGMFVDPLYLLCCIIETLTKYTWVERIRVVHFLLKVIKKITIIPLVRHFTRFVAIVIYPGVRILDRLFHLIDKRWGISTRLIAGSIYYLHNTVYKRQKQRAQIRS